MASVRRKLRLGEPLPHENPDLAASERAPVAVVSRQTSGAREDAKHCSFSPGKRWDVRKPEAALYSVDFSPVSAVCCPTASPVDGQLGSFTLPKMSSSDDSLLLNFQYERTMNFNISEGTILSSSSECSDDGQGIPPYLMLYRQRIRKTGTDFCKYLPAPLSSLTIPKILLNKKDEKEFLEAQEALQPLVPNVSKSDTYIEKGIKKLHTTNLSRVICCVRANDIEGNDKQDVGVPAMSWHDNFLKAFPKFTDPRFNFASNDVYIRMCSDHLVEFSAVLYAQSPRKTNYFLCHVQTELAVAALLAFFHPWTDIQLLWVKNLRAQINELMSTEKYFPKFTEVVYLKRFEAALVVSFPAGKLLRHSKLAFLHSLSAALGMNRNRLLVLSKKS